VLRLRARKANNSWRRELYYVGDRRGEKVKGKGEKMEQERRKQGRF
jgi:hypothetical protein